MKPTALVGLTVLTVSPFLACQEEITTSLESDLIPVEAVTVEVSLPFQEFAGDLVAWGGYGRPYELTRDIVAKAFEGTLDVRILNAWGSYPVVATIPDTTGVYVADSTLAFIGGRIVAHFDTLTSVLEDSVALSVSGLPRDWDFRSATWDVAVDSVGDQQFWQEAGAGPGVPLSTSVWNPAAGDSAVFEIDSAGVALWADTTDGEKGVRLEALTEGTRLDLVNLTYFLSVRPSANPDTVLEMSVPSKARTFIFNPVPGDPEGEIRVGGVPAWRAVFDMTIPEALEGPAELCQQVQCPFTLTTESLISASLVLTTRAPEAAFQPLDTLWLDVRPVLEPGRLPKSPLGSSLVGVVGVLLPPAAFGEEAGTEVEIPLGQYVENLIAENLDPEFVVPHKLALLSSFEPLSLYFASFEGPDSPSRPELRLILTLAEDVRFR